MKDKLTAQYDSLYSAYNHMYGEGKPLKVVERLPQYLAAGGSVLDIGGGEGRNALFLAAAGYRVHIIDLSAVGLRKLEADAQKKNLPVTTAVSDVNADGIGDYYDSFLLTFVLHHMQKSAALALLEDMQKHTNDSGVHVIATFTTNGELAARNAKAQSDRFYPALSQLVELYVDWDIREAAVRMTTTHARRKDGSRMENEMAILVAQKPLSKS